MPSFFMIKYLQYGLALVVGSLYLVFIPEDDVTNIMALTAILFFGVPHGAIDHKIHLKFSKKSNIKKFNKQSKQFIWTKQMKCCQLGLKSKYITFFII